MDRGPAEAVAATMRRPEPKSSLLGRATQLEGFFRELRDTVLDLESAHADGRLVASLEATPVSQRLGAAVAHACRHLAVEPAEDLSGAWRPEAVDALLDIVHSVFFWRQTQFSAELGWLLRPPADPLAVPAQPSRFRVALEDKGPSVEMRLDQLIAARSWGTAFVFVDERLTNKVTEAIAWSAVLRFARDWADLSRIDLTTADASGGGFPPIVRSPSARRLEWLLRDILNEESSPARLANLLEQHSRRTHLRVRLPQAHTRRGARVHVNSIARHEPHEKTLREIPRVEELVVLSPWSLATAIDEHESRRTGEHAGLPADVVQDTLNSLPSRPADREELAELLRQLFASALEEPIRDPRGPLVRVPAPLRRLIREWVVIETERCTRAIHEREALEFAHWSRPDRRSRQPSRRARGTGK